MIGFLNQETAELSGHLVTGFRKGLGFVENQNVEIEYRWAEGRYERVPQLASDLVKRKVAVITARMYAEKATRPAALTPRAGTSQTHCQMLRCSNVTRAAS